MDCLHQEKSTGNASLQQLAQVAENIPWVCLHPYAVVDKHTASLPSTGHHLNRSITIISYSYPMHSVGFIVSVHEDFSYTGINLLT